MTKTVFGRQYRDMNAKTVKFMGEELTPIIGQYVNGQTAIRLVDQDGHPFMTASVAHDVNIDDDCVIIKESWKRLSKLRLLRSRSVRYRPDL